jgi:aryl-alcohol dehydrogenase-like predicted oxidoreductase
VARLLEPQIAIAWVRAQQHRAVAIPIVGVQIEAQLADNLAAVEIDLGPDELAQCSGRCQEPQGSVV